MGDAAPTASPAGFLTEFADGLRFFRRSRVLVALAVSLVLVLVGGGALNALEVFFVTENLGAPTEAYGILAGVQGAGMLAGAILSGVLAMRLGLERMVWGSLGAIGLLILLYARMTDFAPAVAVIFFFGLVLAAINVAVGPLMLRETPRELVGRVSATLNPLTNAAMVVGLLTGGVLYGSVLPGFEAEVLGVRFGPIDTIYAGVGVLCLLGAGYAYATLGRARPGGPGT